jgi:SAM-dependent methyltransferase
MKKDNYDKIHEDYEKTNEKPDKKYSMLPTILNIAKPLENKIVIDIGCGDGFFTFPLAEKAKFVYGIDNSIEQINKAKLLQKENTKFILGNMFDLNYPKSDIICIPFILDMVDTEKLIYLFTKFYSSLETKGRIIGLIDDPKSLISDNRKYGVIKIVKAKKLSDGVPLTIDLFNKDSHIITLNVIYHTKETIENALKKSGFKNIKWHKPIISKKGINKFNEGFWDDYLNNCDVAYFSAIK